VAFGTRERELETISEEDAVSQSGQLVVRRLMGYVLLCPNPFDHPSKLPADLFHHLEQARVGRDRRRGEELQDRSDLASARHGLPAFEIRPSRASHSE
jgi:hypothetical protein